MPIWLSKQGMVPKGGLSGNREIDSRTCDLGRWNCVRPRNSNSCCPGAMVSRVRAATARERLPSRQFVRLGCHGEPHEIVNNQRSLMWHFWCTYTHSVLERPGRAQIMSDLMMLQRLAERAVPPEAAPKVPRNGRNGSFGGVFRASVHRVNVMGKSRRRGHRSQCAETGQALVIAEGALIPII